MNSSIGLHRKAFASNGDDGPTRVVCINSYYLMG